MRVVVAVVAVELRGNASGATHYQHVTAMQVQEVQLGHPGSDMKNADELDTRRDGSSSSFGIELVMCSTDVPPLPPVQ